MAESSQALRGMQTITPAVRPLSQEAEVRNNTSHRNKDPTAPSQQT